jgi:starvation-inducible DNA-binding protein
MDELKKAMKIAFASEYAFAIKAQNFHWNVEGPLFPQLHMLFGTVYTEVYGAIDDFAENIRKLGSYTPASYSRFSMLTQVEDELNILEDRAMIAELLQDSDKMVK